MGIKQPNVYLTKVLYYDGERHSFNRIRTISGTLDIHSPMKDKPEVIIKRNIFGHKWVLKLNETAGDRKSSSFTKLTLYVFVFTAIVLAFLFGLLIFFGSKYLESTIFDQREYMFKTVPIVSKTNKMLKINKTEVVQNITVSKNATQKPPDRYRISSNYSAKYNSQLDIKNKSAETNFTGTDPPCSKCANNTEICFQEPNNQFPKCRGIVDSNDPTGCGGICKLNVQYCKRLVNDLEIFSCIDIERFTCQENEWACEDAPLCISKEKKCDGMVHCFDKSDEMNCECDLTHNFRCGQNISCIPNGKKCDGTVDCWDALDELNCPHNCSVSEIPCSNGQCVPKIKFCDGNYDCSDNSDEPDGCKSIAWS